VGKLVSEKGIRGLVPGFAMVKVEVEVAAGDKGSGAEMVVDEIWRVVVDEIWRVVVDGEHTKGLGMTFRDVYGPIACECDVNGGLFSFCALSSARILSPPATSGQ
jgi:hypothetical protein